MKQIKEKTTPNVQKIILGNKLDLQSEREVSEQEGQNMADKYSEPNNKVTFMEVSAKEGNNV